MVKAQLRFRQALAGNINQIAEDKVVTAQVADAQG
jgi:hypothetical protein